MFVYAMVGITRSKVIFTITVSFVLQKNSLRILTVHLFSLISIWGIVQPAKFVPICQRKNTYSYTHDYNSIENGIHGEYVGRPRG